MGRAARANPMAQSKRAGELRPRDKVARRMLKHGDIEKMWVAFLARIASTPKKASAA